MKESSFKFRNPKLTKIAYRANRDFEVDEMDGAPMSSETTVQRGDATAVVSLSVQLFSEALEKGEPFWLDIEMEADFAWDSNELNAQQVDKFLGMNAPAVLLSYMRPYIASLTSGSGYPPYIIPFMDFSDNIIDE